MFPPGLLWCLCVGIKLHEPDVGTKAKGASWRVSLGPWATPLPAQFLWTLFYCDVVERRAYVSVPCGHSAHGRQVWVQEVVFVFCCFLSFRFFLVGMRWY